MARRKETNSLQISLQPANLLARPVRSGLRHAPFFSQNGEETNFLTGRQGIYACAN